RAAIPNLTALLVFDALRTWVIPVVAGAVIVATAALSATGLVPVEGALATAIVAALVLLAYVGERPLLAADAPRRDQLIGLGFTVVWLAFCYVPFYTRIIPGAPLLDAVDVQANGSGLPLRIPAAGHRAIDLVLEGKLSPNPTGGAAAPVHYRVTLESAGARAVVGAAVIFWTSNAVHPDFRTLIGSAIFGGPVGFAAGALLWWAAKKLIARPGR